MSPRPRDVSARFVCTPSPPARLAANSAAFRVASAAALCSLASVSAAANAGFVATASARVAVAGGVNACRA